MLRPAKKKCQCFIYKGKPIRFTSELSMKTIKAKGSRQIFCSHFETMYAILDYYTQQSP